MLIAKDCFETRKTEEQLPFQDKWMDAKYWKERSILPWEDILVLRIKKKIHSDDFPPPAKHQHGEPEEELGRTLMSKGLWEPPGKLSALTHFPIKTGYIKQNLLNKSHRRHRKEDNVTTSVTSHRLLHTTFFSSDFKPQMSTKINSHSKQERQMTWRRQGGNKREGHQRGR